MQYTVSHDRQQETPEAKARWFQSLTLAERMEYLCAITDMAIENNPQVLKQKHAQPAAGRVRVLDLEDVRMLEQNQSAAADR